MRPWFWALGYLLLIPIFAFCYYGLEEDSFYHATAKYDHAVVGDRDRIIGQLTTIILAQLHLPRQNHDGIVIDNVAVTDYRVSDDIFTRAPATIELSIDCHASRVYSYNISAEALLDPSVTLNVSTNVVTTFVTFKPVSVSVGDNKRSIVRRRSIVLTDIFPRGSLDYPLALRYAMAAYRRAHAGFPTYSSSDQFGRMLYLSATTVTTLGYGDIQPLTPHARALTALEAIGGIVLIGLFLNALSSRYKGLER